MTPFAHARLAAVWTLLFALPGQAYLEDGVATANSDSSTGFTTNATTPLTLFKTDLGGSGIGPANATHFGPMTSMQLASSCSISNSAGFASNAQSEVRFTDMLTLEVPGLAVGEEVIAKIAFEISGNATRSQSGDVLVQSLAVADSPLTTWKKETSNAGGPFTFDSNGTIVFEFPIKVNLPEEDNVDLSVRAASQCGNIGNPINSFSGNVSSDITVTFAGMVDVTTTGGTKLYAWTVDAESGLSYGAGDPPPPPPAIPELSIDPSQITPGDLTVSWNADPAQNLIVQSSTDGQGWFQEQAIVLASNSFEANPPTNAPALLYRIVSTNATGPLSNPLLTISPSPSPSPGNIRLRWQADAAETYRIFSGSTLQGWSEIQVISGASGLLTIEVAKPDPTQFYRLVTSFT